MDKPVFALETIYTDALKKLHRLRDSNRLSQQDYEIITGTYNLQNLDKLLQAAISRGNDKIRSESEKKKVQGAMESILFRFERFGKALDMLAQSSPALMGINVLGFVWGSVRLVITIAQDIHDSFDTVLNLLEEIVSGLPKIDIYVHLFGSSEHQLLKTPLVDIFTELVVFGTRALELFDRSAIRTIARSTWRPLQEDFKQTMLKIRRLGKEIDQKATVEHMHQSTKASQLQALENQKAEDFREEARKLLGQVPYDGGDLQFLSTELNIQEAPIHQLSVNFTGRQHELARIDNFFADRSDCTTKGCAIYGMAGIGKTQLVLRYAKTAYERRLYQQIFWISARTNERVRQGLADILSLVRHVDRHNPEDSARMLAARRWLEQHQAANRPPWLLICDNVARGTIEMLRSHLPRNNYGGHIIFTARTEDLAKALVESQGDQYEILGLQALSVDNAAQLLLDGAGLHNGEAQNTDDVSKARGVVQVLGCLPLAVESAASFLRQTHKSLDELAKLYNSKDRAEVFAWDNDLSTYEQKSVAATFSLQLEDLDRHSPEGGTVMKIFSFLDPESFGTDVLVRKSSGLLERLGEADQGGRFSTLASPFKRVWQKVSKRDSLQNSSTSTQAIYAQLQILVPLFESTTKFLAAIRHLQQLSLIETQAKEPPTFRMHELIQMMVQDRMRVDRTQQLWFHCAEALLCSAFLEISNPGSYTSWSQCELFIPHIEALTRWAEIHGERSTWLRPANVALAEYFRARGRYGDAEAIYKSSLDDLKIELGPRHLDTLQATQDLASVYQLQGRYNEAEGLYCIALKETRNLLGSDNLKTLQNLQNLAIIHIHMGHYETAEPLLRKALAGRTKRLGSEHKDCLRTAHSLASVLKHRNWIAEAEDLFQTTLQKREELLGTDHQDTLSTAQEFGSLRLVQGRLDDAERLYERVLKGREKQFGPAHPQTFRTLQNIALLYTEQGHYEKAEGFYSRALAGRVKILGSDHPETLLTLQNLAILHERQQRYEESERLFKDALKGFEKQLGSGHPHTVRTRVRYASFLEQQGRQDEAAAVQATGSTG